MNSIQYDLFEKSLEEKFKEWIHTTEGGMAMNFFIREARRMKKRGFNTCGAKMIAEHIRWLMKLEAGPSKNSEDFKINNNYISYMARYAMQKDEFLRGFFQLREIGRNVATRAIVIPIRAQAS